MMQFVTSIITSLLLVGHVMAQDVGSFLDVEVAEHQYHENGADDANDITAKRKHEKLTPKAWLTQNVPMIFSQDYINYELHDQLVAQNFDERGMQDFKAWQKKQITILVRHQYIVKASLVEDVNLPFDERGTNEYRLPIKLMFFGYDHHAAKKVDVINATVHVQLQPDPVHDWVINKLSVIINDHKEQNKNPA